ncbi:MAG: ECF transporter S component [Pyrinomonadaceae bacterium]|nr:ECF transporter S component [Pyrinomonadaceae bacterium]
MSSSAINETRLTLPAFNFGAISIQAVLLITAAFLLPAAAHAIGLPVRSLLPMHWPVILVGLVYGWRSGALVGAAAPGLSHLLSGHPQPNVLAAMTVELAVYGFLAGFFREKLRLNVFLATALALIGGRLVFIASAYITNVSPLPFPEYLQAAMLPGMIGAAAQLVLLPIIATVWVNKGKAE